MAGLTCDNTGREELALENDTHTTDPYASHLLPLIPFLWRSIMLQMLPPSNTNSVYPTRPPISCVISKNIRFHVASFDSTHIHHDFVTSVALGA